ncbi:2-oxoacid:acceptor oxidoreductase family protein [Adlercreutzia sp. ZJ138]|uniref:2-oxoacid:acceptor oxidoreductase family protein n=1 Tax=Adlercreutzia sp. ZJ138 TaxID=2709405 RepID=UPI0013EBB50B|nr:2-oxoacid:acceptor oxidoreductase family protein [Adlercreutzia sp. ZJ138]
MIEILWHGRGGQGAFTAARLLGAASSLREGRYALAFPSFGPERRGAPMRAFTKVSDAPIGDRSAVTRADYVVYLDETLLSSGWQAEVKPGGCVLVNSARSAADLTAAFGDSVDAHIIAIDANGISEALLGRPIPNTVFLGAISALGSTLSADEVKQAIRQYMPAKLHEKNERIVDEARRVMREGSVDGEEGTLR